jgi:hypothetical protein
MVSVNFVIFDSKIAKETGMTISKKLFLIPILVLGLVLGLGGAAKAQQPLTPGALLTLGVGAGFPESYTDNSGVVLGLCLDEVACAAEIVGGVLGEAIYYAAEAAMEGPNGELFLDIIAVEAFFGEPVVEGDPAPRTVANAQRIRLRNLVVQGTYTVTTPFGIFDFVGGPGADIDEEIPINDALEPDFVFGAAGPILLYASNGTGTGLAAGDFFGDGVTEAPLAGVGFGTGTNFFRVQGPGGIDVTQNNFVVAGQIFAPIVDGGIVVNRATLSRSTAGDQLDVFVTAPIDTTNLSASALPAFASTPLLGDGSGRFFASIVGNIGVGAPPAIVTVTDGTNTVLAPVNDLVTITKADYIPAIDTLLVVASSTMAGATLTAEGLGTLTGGSLVVQNLPVPPASVTVVSSAGGAAQQPVSIISGGAAGITVTRATFLNRTGRLTLSGRGPAGAQVTILGPAGQIAAVNAGATGAFRFAGPANLGGGNTLTLFSTGGAFAAGVPVIVR